MNAMEAIPMGPKTPRVLKRDGMPADLEEDGRQKSMRSPAEFPIRLCWKCAVCGCVWPKSLPEPECCERCDGPRMPVARWGFVSAP